MSKLKKYAMVSSAVLAAGALMIEPAMAASVGDVAGNLTTSTTGVTKAVGAISTACGFIMAFVGALKFKAHKDNAQQVPISIPIVYLLVAALLLFLPTVIDTTGDTLFGDGKATSQGMTGSGLETAIGK